MKAQKPAVAIFPKFIWLCAAVYFVASLTHFAHNAEYLAFYPNMPGWITRGNIYIAWLAITGVGLAALVVSMLGLRVIGAVLLALYGALGLDGLGHYSLALCSAHTIGANLSIWFEVIAGSILLVACAWFAKTLLISRTHIGV